MTDVEFMEELDNAANMRAIIAKVPYKLRERWRSVVCSIQEHENRRTKFNDLVDFINKQAKEALHPLFGDIKDTSKGSVKGQTDERLRKRSDNKGSFVTAATITSNEVGTPKSGRKATDNQVCAFSKPCLFCHGAEHSMEQCKRLKKSLHKEKIDFLRAKGLCFSCLNPGHMSNTCSAKMTCQICTRLHPTLLHLKFKNGVAHKDRPEDELGKNEERPTESVVSGFVGTKATTNRATSAEAVGSILAIVPVQVKSNKGQRVTMTYAFLDPGSTACFCTESLMKELNLTGRNTHILLKTMGEERIVSSHIVSGSEVSNLDCKEFLELPDMFSQKTIPATKDNIPLQEDVDKWPHLQGVLLPKIEAEIGLLIGTNAPKAIEPWQVIASVKDGPYAVRTQLGWTINGPLREDDGLNAVSGPTQVQANRIEVASLEEIWDQQFQCDFPEHNQQERLEMSREDIQFLDEVTQSVKLVDGHYSIALPLKNKNVKMPNNRKVAEQRALNLKRKFIKNPTFHAEYVAFINGVIEKGYAVKVPSKDLKRDDGRVWYLPHHRVYHPRKKTLRVVFDCGASFQGTTLNDQLLQGPNLTSTLLGVITRFRQEEVAVIADVEAMFHQVKVPDEDSDLLRFLWWTSGDVGQEMVEYKMVVHLFGATSSPSCANFALRKCAEDNRTQSNIQAVDTVLRNFYVDDCLKSVPSEEEAVSLYQTLLAVCEKGGFRLTKWISNSRAVLSAIPEKDRAKEVKDLNLDRDALPIERALGLQWCIESDSFRFKIILPDKAPTRRNILSLVSSIYDPLGILSPVVLSAKRLLQELCRLKIGWDVLIPEELVREWSAWKTALHQLMDVRVPRCFKPPGFGETVFNQLHHFADASKAGYGTVSYLLQKNNSNKAHCAFVIGKARVAPLKPMTIPHMELTAATMAARMDKTLRSELQLELQESIFWTDSTTVQKYIQNRTSRFCTFVANRVEIILKISAPHQWRYVSTSLNPADYASRGLKAEKFIQSHDWLQGPEFLTKPSEEWPENPEHYGNLTTEDPEVRGVTVCATAPEPPRNSVAELMQHFSSWIRLKRAVAWVLKIKRTLLNVCRKRKELSTNLSAPEVDRQMRNFKAALWRANDCNLTVENLKDAEQEIVRYCQGKVFTKDSPPKR